MPRKPPPKNKPRPVFRWRLTEAAQEFDIDKDTLSKRFKALSIEANPEGLYSTAQVCDARFGNLRFEQTRKTKAEADKAELDLMERAGKVVPIEWARQIIEEIGVSLRQKVLALQRLNKREKDKLLRELMAIDVSKFTPKELGESKPAKRKRTVRSSRAA